MSTRTEPPPPAPLPVEHTGGDGPLRSHWSGCFGCGPDQQAGLGLAFVRSGDVIRATTTLGLRFQGAPGLAHGGIVSAILDDMSGAVPVVLGQRAVTARLEVDFSAPVVLGHELVAESWLESFDGRKIRIVSRLLDGDTVLAIGRALFLTVPREHFTGPDIAAGRSVAP
ncbi:PaaI family thioesterase [Patulibacter sp.]|uniref:PaaI family thioesterase n=1 Tax=Patulibacter sp. TaxID=1912859 RepID=UPI002728C648|nr:PaaI family thioesterase [Patulibacter sp.]MDO9410484.1 PaaI family thioesterase [Patulibacter sp.]